MTAGRHEQRPGIRVRARWLVALAALLALLVATVAPGSASAAGKTVKSQLSLTGLANADNPLGGSVIGIKPGDKVQLTTASVPTRGLDKLGLGGLVDGLLNGLLPVKAVADFSKLPGGKAKTTVEKAAPGKTPLTFSFPKVGTYTFTWSIVQVSLLGLVPVKLDGNQLEKAGVKLNAGNQYIGKIVVSNTPPKGGISIQLPQISVAPSLPVVGQLPTITVPGLTPPTVQAPVPDLNPTKSSAPSKAPTSGGSSSSGPDFNYTPPGLSIPDQVVPQGGSDQVFVGDGGTTSGGGGGGFNGVLPEAGSVLGGSKSGSNGAGSAALPAYNAGNGKTIELAADTGSPTSQVPVILAILAIIALALVAGTYARLFLLKKQV